MGVGETSSVETFTFDQIFNPKSTQSEVYLQVGKPTIDDILAGYNGTIFAYGQTGSGKTHTMLGSLTDENEQGVIPRAANQIFETINSDETETEFTIKCSMLEIYKESLRDLLEIESNNLQIKECPRKGIYVQGLTNVCVTSEHEVIDLLCLGQQLRTVASTKLNSNSSRSHFLFFLEVTQKLENDSEKKGILNLVDLAGSEKVNHSGVTGNNLEEAKKINLSLSALGKVINSLILNHDHIPYRDSKLTRLLQESLGGNFKTTLLVNCSPAARSQNETIDSLRFAVRAKAIKNKVRINVKNPPENYIKMIEMLKNELNTAKSEIRQLRAGKIASVESKEKSQGKSAAVHSRKKSAGNLKPPQGPLTRNSMQVPELPKLSMTTESDLSYLPTQEKNNEDFLINSSFQLPSFEYEKLNQQINSLMSEKDFLNSRIRDLELKLQQSKKKQLTLEQKSHEIYQSYSTSINIIHKDSTENGMLRLRNEKLQKQVNRLTKQLEDSDKKHKFALGEFKNFRDNTIIEFKQDSENSFRPDIPVITQQPEETRTLSFSSFFISCDPTHVTNPYSENLRKAIEDPNFFNKDYTIFILKQQILQAAVTNNELVSTISNLNWKISLLKHKYYLKREQCQYQQEHLKKLEEIIDHLHNSYTRIVSITEKIELNSLKNTPLQRNKTLRSVTNKLAFTSRVGQKRPTESSKNILTQLQSRLDDPSMALRMKELESNINLQKLFNTQLKRNNDIFKTQAQKYLEVLNEFERTSIEAEKSERARWRNIFGDLVENAGKELARKQEEIISLNNVLAGWVNSFMSMQEASGCQVISEKVYFDVMELIKRTVEALEQVDLGGINLASGFSMMHPKSSSLFLSSFKGDIPI